MRVISIAALAGLGVCMTACAAPGTQSSSSCDGYIQPGSAFQQDIAKGGSKCFPVESGDGRHGYGLVAANDSMMFFMFKGHGPKTRMIQPDDSASRIGVVNRSLPDKVPVQLDGVIKDAKLSRQDNIKTHETMACLTSDQGPTLTYVCRSVGISANDQQVLAVAKEAITKDFAAMMP